MSGNPRSGSISPHRNSVAAGAAALAAQAELEPLENAKLEAEIPDELKEDPVPESLFAMDKRMTELLSDINVLLESRSKDFQNTIGRRDRLPVLPPVSVFEQFKRIRESRLDQVLKFEHPVRGRMASRQIQEEMETYWNVDAELAPNRLFDILLLFFKDKAARVLEENALLLSRWNRFCRSSYDISKLYPTFERAQSYLQNEYKDAVDRFERLYEAQERKERANWEHEARLEQERLEFERRGLLPGGRPKPGATDTTKQPRPISAKAKPSDAKPQKESSPPQPAAESAPPAGDSFDDTVFEVGDLAVFARWVITRGACTRDVEIFLRRLKTLPHSDRVQMLKDYRTILNVKPAQGMLESTDMLDGINNYIQTPPTRPPRIEDFLTEFDLLVLHHEIECPIAQEDGRPFCHEVDARFRVAFAEQGVEMGGLGTYELCGEESGAGGGQGGGGVAGAAGGVGDKATLAGLCGVFVKPVWKSLSAPKLRVADWVNDIRIGPEYEEWQEAQNDVSSIVREEFDLTNNRNIGTYQTRHLKSKETDFELRAEHDLILSNDLDFVTTRLRDNAHRLFDQSHPSTSTSPTSSSLPSSRPSSARNQRSKPPSDPDQQPQESVALGGAGRSVPPKDEDPQRLLKPFDLGMMVPDGGVARGLGSTVLEGKKQVFGSVLRSNAEMRMVEQEVIGVGEDGDRSGRVIVEPTVSTIFAEHEIYAFFQLRHIRLRELRMKMLRQLNFFRSVEKRVNLDTRMTNLRNDLRLTDQSKLEKGATNVLGTAAMVAHMWHQQDLFEMPDPSALPSSRPGSATSLAPQDHPAVADSTPFEDARTISDGWVTVKDHKGVSFIYDAAFTDLRALETNLLKVATTYINNQAGGQEHVSMSYMDDLRFRLSDRKTEFQDATFLNPSLDRVQLLLELYEAEVKFQFAKMELVNVYLEAFEHTSDVHSIDPMAKIIVNVMHLRPHMDFQAPYFSRDYALSTKALEIQSRTAVAVVSHMVKNYRSWIRRHYLKLDRSIQPEEGDDDMEMPAEAEMPLARKIETPLVAGLPFKPDAEKNMVIMHHAGVQTGITEVVPGMEILIAVHEAARVACVEMRRCLEDCLPDVRHLNHSVQSAVWKSVFNAWTNLAQQNFRPPVKSRRVVGRLDCDVWIENPLLPDIVLAEQYVPLGQRDAGTAKSLNVPIAMWTPLTDPTYATKGKEVIQRILKTVVLKDRLMFSWVETEYWRRTYETQFPQMGIANRTAYTGRLNSLRFDMPDVADTTAVEDEIEEDLGETGDHAAEVDEEGVTIRHDPTQPKYAFLAISELDDGYTNFDFFGFAGILGFLGGEGLVRLREALKIQLIERGWLMPAAEMNHLVMTEIHGKLLTEKEEDRPKVEKSKGTQRKAPSRQSQTLQTQQTFDVDYRMLLTSMIPRKRTLRKLMLAEYVRDSKSVLRYDMKDEERDIALQRYKITLYDWYFSNMLEVTTEECERAEYAKLMTEFRKCVNNTSHGRLLFRMSRINKHVEYFAFQDKGAISEGETDPSKVTMDSVQIQEVVTFDLGVVEKICKIWYLPHITELVMIPTGAEKPSKGGFDPTQKTFKNSLIFQRSCSLQSLLFDLFVAVETFARLLQDNCRHGPGIRAIRQAEYAVHAINSIKRDLSHQGAQVDFQRTEQQLAGKWTMWNMKFRTAVAASLYALDMKLMPQAYNTLLADYATFLAPTRSQENTQTDFAIYRKALSPSQPFTSQTTLFLRHAQRPSPYIFSHLAAEAKPLCSSKVQELEECIEEYLQAASLNFGENAEELNQSQTDCLISMVKLVALRREYLKVMFGEEVVKTETVLAEFFRMYKMKILVPAVKLYHRIGAKGNASTSHLLRDESVTQTVDFDYNRIAQAAFEKCQVTILQNELLRCYTQQILSHARRYYDRLSDERSGQLFKVYDTVGVPSASGEPEYAFKIGEDAYEQKQALLFAFVAELNKVGSQFIKDNKPAAKPTSRVSKVTSSGAAVPAPVMIPLDEHKVFACTKDQLTQAIVKLGLQLSKFQEKRKTESDNFMGTLYSRMLDLVRYGEKLLRYMAQERKELLENYKRDVRLSSTLLTSTFYTELSTISAELNDLRKHRRIDEKKLRNRIIDDYDDLVHELVSEINVLRARFSEHRISTAQEVMEILSEVKKEALLTVAENRELPEEMRRAAVEGGRREESFIEWREDNHELRMVLLKLRSMFNLKEHSMRSVTDKQIRKFTEDSKRAEEKLWDSYRDAEAREGALRKQLIKAQKALAAKETENENLTKQMKEEQTRQFDPKGRARSAGRSRPGTASLADYESDAAKIQELQSRLRRYEGINLDNLIHELTEKTRLLEQLIREKQEWERERERTGFAVARIGGMTGARKWEGTRRAVSARLQRKIGLVRAVGGASSGEDEDSGFRMERDINGQMLRKMNELALENGALKGLLTQHGIEVPVFRHPDDAMDQEGMRVAWAVEATEEPAERPFGMAQDSMFEPQEEAEMIDSAGFGRSLDQAGDAEQNPDTANLLESTSPPGTGASRRINGSTEGPPPRSNRATLDASMSGALERARPSGSAKAYRKRMRYIEAPDVRGGIIASRLTYDTPGRKSPLMTVPTVLRTPGDIAAATPRIQGRPRTAPVFSRPRVTSRSEEKPTAKARNR
ncbi:hypothetical protein HK097_004593 [Rhizophlyctis rosea]|uniref:DUF4549 domain-containing protein n=1 Tax=Rhizophlyctis rosea TaxID=64517 RepID=A0AAD5X4W3_9FUNG|nr:hypothetical protein HK097_004593 [Rhizophlyctis rosea]